MSRQQEEIEVCIDKLRQLVDHFRDAASCFFCQTSRVVTVDAVFLISHLIVVHERAVVEEKLDENAETAILRIRTHLKGQSDSRKSCKAKSLSCCSSVD